MEKLIRNDWREQGARSRARILRADLHPEGLNVDRVRFSAPDTLSLDEAQGHILSLVRGAATLQVSQDELHLQSPVHVYIPPGSEASLRTEGPAELVWVYSQDPAQAAGPNLLVRDETFLRASAAPDRPMRWILTPQYLSRRAFLHHDRTLRSKQDQPIAWFHTTMFDVEGLPLNAEREPVFMMGYNYRTEPNVCYDVAGEARVRMALHPYSDTAQTWGPWGTLDSETTYHLNEAKGGPDEERTPAPLRNKHEVYIRGGYVTLLCMFDPAPTGAEAHRAGAYSDYGPLDHVLGTPRHTEHLEAIRGADAMIDALSLAKAKGQPITGGPSWDRFQAGLKAQESLERALLKRLDEAGEGRAKTVRPWCLEAETSQK